jgi:hypothetical protein
VGIGTYTSSGTTLSRTTVLSSSNSGSLVNFSAGTKDVFVDYPASKAVYEDASGNIDSYPITGGTIDNTVIGGTTPAAGSFTTLTATTAGTATAKVWSNTNTSPIADLELQRGTNATWGGDAFTDYRIRATGGNFVLQSQNNTTSVLDILTADETNNAIKFSPVGVEQMRVTRTASAVNYVQVTGSVTNPSVGTIPTISVQGSDASTYLGIGLKGTGGYVSFYNNGSPSATTTLFRVRNATGTLANYFSVYPSISGNAPYLAAEGSDTNIAQVFQSKGTGAIDLAAGSSGVNISNGGTVTAITRTAGGSGYATAPTVAISAPTTAGGVQATATCTVTAGSVDTTFTITNAGSGYVEQPTVTFSGGGGSGAAAYATVGSGTTVKSLGSTLSFSTPSSEVLRIVDNNPSSQNYLQLESSGAGSVFRTAGASANPSFGFVNKGTGSFYFSTSNSTGNVQFNVAHTASAVNYVQVTGAATGAIPAITVQGSDTNIRMNISSKGTESVDILTNNTGTRAAKFTYTASSINWVQMTGAAAGASPSYAVAGSDTDIDLTLTPKGAGNVRFGTYTAGVLTPTGYITIKDSGGTTRRLLVG